MEAVPQARVGDVHAQFLLGIVRQHAGVARQHGTDAILAHPLQDFLLQGHAVLIPLVAVGAAPTFEVVHQPPGLESRTGNEGIGLVLGIAQFQQDIAPCRVSSHQSQRQVDAVQGHPVDFLLPACPVPESHAVGMGTVIQIIAVLQQGLVPLLLSHGRQHGRQFGLHAVPRQVDAGIILQVPIDARGDADIIVATHHDAAARLVQLEKVGVTALQFDFKLARSARVNTFQQAGNRRCLCQDYSQAEGEG